MTASRFAGQPSSIACSAPPFLFLVLVKRKIVGQRPAIFGFHPVVRRPVKSGALRVVDVGWNPAPDAKEEVVFDATRRWSQMQPLSANRPGEVSHQIAMRTHFGGGPVGEAAVIYGEAVVMLKDRNRVSRARFLE
jgi:hypothetical protein